MLNYSAIPAIVVLCYIAITAVKSTKVDKKWLPIISCLIGACLAAAMYYVLPDFIAANTLTAAIISGAASGLAATGTNQIIKQLLKAAENGEDLNTAAKGNNAGPVEMTENETVRNEHNVSNGVKRTNDTGGTTENNAN